MWERTAADKIHSWILIIRGSECQPTANFKLPAYHLLCTDDEPDWVSPSRSALPLPSARRRTDDDAIKRPSDLIVVVFFTRCDKYEIHDRLAVVDLASRTAPLTANADAGGAFLGNAEVIKDQGGGPGLDRRRGILTEVCRDLFVFPRTVTDESLKLFLLVVSAGGELQDSLATSGAQKAPEVARSMEPRPFPLRPRRSVRTCGERRLLLLEELQTFDERMSERVHTLRKRAESVNVPN